MKTLTFAGLLLALNFCYAAAGTLEDIRSAGILHCGVDQRVEGFSAVQKDGIWTGFSVDVCRALALAVLDDAAKVNFHALESAELVEALQSGEVDVLVSALAVKAEYESRDGLLFTEPLYFHETNNGLEAFAAGVRQGDDRWFLAVRWLRHMLLQQPLVNSQSCTAFNAIAELNKDWACKVVANYGGHSDMLARHFNAMPTGYSNKPAGEGGLFWAPSPD